MTIDYKAIGRRVRAARLHRGMTQAELAEKTGLSDVYMSYIETGSRKPSLDALLKITRVLNTSFDSLLLDAPSPRK